MKSKTTVLLSVLICIGISLPFISLASSNSDPRDPWLSARKDAGLVTKSVQVDKHTVVYNEGGKGDTILFIHGFGGQKDTWTLIAKYLTPEYHVVALDVPGFGESSKLQDEIYSIPRQVKRIRETVEALGLGEHHIVGASLGAAIAGKYAVDYPDSVLSLSLFSGGASIGEESEWTKILKSGGKNPLLPDSKEDFDSSGGFFFYEIPEHLDKYDGFFSDQATGSKDFNQKILADTWYKEPYAFERDMGRVKAKTFIMWGDTDRLVHVSNATILEKGIPGAKKVIIEKCGHMTQLEKPEEAANHYLSFLKSIK